MRKWNTALGFYQNFSIANSVLDALQRGGFRRLAYIHHTKENGLVVKRLYPTGVFFGAVVAAFVFLAVLLFQDYLVGFNWLLNLGVATILLVICGGFVLWHWLSVIDKKVVDRFKSHVVLDEILVIAQIPSKGVREALAILRQVESGHPLSFLLRPELDIEEKDLDLPKEPLTSEQLRRHGISVATDLSQKRLKWTYAQTLLKRLKQSERTLQFLRHDVAEAEHIEQTMTVSAEWLLDNMYVIEGSIDEIQRNLPKKYYRELPKIAEGQLAGLPRIYAIASEIINGTAGRLNRENITDFLNSYQTVQPLTIGELWALSLMLRLRLIEWVQSLTIHVDRRMREGELAGFWGNRLLCAARRDPDRLPLVLSDLVKEQSTPSSHFAEELLDHLFDEEAVLPPVKKWLEEYFSISTAEIIHREQMEETAEQVVFSNSIISLITLSQLSWQEIFEDVSPVDRILKNDPAGAYAGMDFTTRNSYRKSVERIARYSHRSEVDVAERALERASKGSSEFERHVGYHLIDKGRVALEKSVGYSPSLKQRIRRWMVSYPTAVYLGGIGFFTLFFEAGIVHLSINLNLGLLETSLLAFFSLIPLSEVSCQLINFLLTQILPPTALPKMSFEKGIPPECKTLVVVPSMLSNPEAIQEEVHRLEIRYLANPDPSLLFALFCDFSDAPQQHMKEDAALLETVLMQLKALESKYGAGKFFLFHRQRLWSNGEDAWIGWERKRGKLEYLNRFLCGETLPENILYLGDPINLKGIRYVITLDSDTQLPKNKANEMIEVITHPLNAPYLTPDGKGVLRGYSIIQPRVCTDFSHTKISLFSKIFSEPAAVDPYTQAISNVYQDLAGEGTYHGKGIYDLKAFHSVLSGCFPEGHLLSHDLLEGVYVRVGFASDICLFDLFPEDYLSWANRQHRWMRGDFQIMDWTLPRIPLSKGRYGANPLSLLNRWKIFDNLRRAFVPISLLALLLFAWTLPFSIAAVLSGIATSALFSSTIILLITKFFHLSFPSILLSWNEMIFGMIRSVITIALLPYESLLGVDALCRVIYRRWISHRRLLQWISSGYGNHSSEHIHRSFLIRSGWISFFAILIFTLVAYLNPGVEAIAVPFCLLWAAAPFIVYIIDKPLAERTDEKLSEAERESLRRLARRTWRYFDDFVGPQTHWLPPDNYQAALKIEVAPRTSPTNIGLWLLAVMSAYDFKYITSDDVIEKILATLQELQKLERYEGHFLNWYDTQSLNPLYPRYISTVDSGNLLACMWTLEQGVAEMISSPLLSEAALIGVEDAYDIFTSHQAKNKLQNLSVVLRSGSNNPLRLITVIQDALQIVQKMVGEEDQQNAQNQYWLRQVEKQLSGWDSIASRYFSWISVLKGLSEEQLNLIDPSASIWMNQSLSYNPSLDLLALGEFPQALHQLQNGSQKEGLPIEIIGWGKQLKEAMSKAQWFAGEKKQQAKELIKNLQQFSEEMNLKCLYNDDRKLFAIGYNVDERRLDSSYYDLLASEARISSLIAIAKENIPLEHWWALGRPYNIVQGKRILLSWGGTMFEYLMPLIFNKHYSDSLLGEACKNVVACQIKYGQKRGIPWGISEAAFSAIDAHRIYQYRSFGVPGVGLKRGLEKDLVVSPYSTALALAVQPLAAIKNLKKMAEGNQNLLGSYGYYESIDFTRQSDPGGERGVIVYAYMAHHQGMILASINNILNNNIMPNRFHADPRICGVESLLYERIPSSRPVKISGFRQEVPTTRLKPFSVNPIMGVVETAHSITPKVNLLSNGKYSVMITNAGGGYSRWRDIDITRWRADATKDSWGSFYYIKDQESGEFWSSAYHPTRSSGRQYSVSSKADKSEFKRRDSQIETLTEIVVSPEDDAEIRMITLVNHSAKIRYLELTSYVELALAPHATDRAHPCFNKLFIETEALPELSGLLAFRRLRSPEDAPVWAAHVVSTSQPCNGDIQYETDRSRFIGRGCSLQHPTALMGDLSNTSGTVLDPIFSLRRSVVIEPGRRVQLSFTTAIADTRSAALGLMKKYQDFAASVRAMELAWTYAQLELRHLRIHQEEVQLFQKLAGRILYPHAQLRSAEERLRNNLLGQSCLWAHGISGDLPIVVVTVGDIYDVDLVKQVLIAHAFWTLRGLKSDLIILNEESSGYEQPLFEQLQRMIQAFADRSPIEAPGGVFLRSSDKIPPNELNLILVVARAVLVAARGSLRQQLVSPLPAASYPARLIVDKKIKEEPSRSLPFLQLPYFNGVGGFAVDGRTYSIYLDAKLHTPAPWINVIANPQFGTLVSEAGVGCTWYGNSQTNRLTPWSNDPVLDPLSDVIYIRDEETGTVWTPTPSPIRELDAYRVNHSQGCTRFEHNSHGVEQELLVFVPINDAGGLPLRIQRLRLSNNSSQHRRLTVTGYSEWVLGTNKEETQTYVITDWDPESQALFAYNRYNPDFSGHVAFSYSLPPAASFTADRAEFLGRNSSVSSPASLKRKGLSGRTGAALDPCSAQQILVKLAPGDKAEVIFVLGYAADTVAARKLMLQCQNSGIIDQLFSESQAYWNKILGTIQVETPDLAVNFAVNRWLLYQSLSCRLWGRSGFYQSSGAYGFRDQLQDVMALVYSLPSTAREYILYAASRQFVEGDVQHWWHPQSGGGVRTRISDDRLWLPFVTAHYVRTTGDASILDEKIPFLEAPSLEENQHEAYQVPTPTQETETLLEHCRRAINRSMGTGPHGLPLIGGGDWNDGMNRVGIEGKGESVWLAWFLIHVMHDFADLLTYSGRQESGEGFKIQAKRLAEVVEETGWDGGWYRRAYFDDGVPLGSTDNSECIIDSLAQSWAVICGLGNPQRTAQAMQAADASLVDRQNNIVRLLTPPFDHSSLDPGYIKGYPPGVRENGGQYTHGSLWLAMAYARMGDGDKAVSLLRMMHPVTHAPTKEASDHYKVEPYVVAADIYDLAGQVGRGGWTWYTGSSSWMYRIWLEEVLGFKLRGNILKIECVIPAQWERFKIRYQYQTSLYEITVENPHRICRGLSSITLDGIAISAQEIPLVNDGQGHIVNIVMEKKA